MGKSSLQRDPNRYSAYACMDIELAAKVKTAIDGEMVERKTRAIKHGNFASKDTPIRQKTIGDALVELADKKYGKLRISRKAQAWKKEQLAKNIAKRRVADAAHKRR